MKRIIIKQLRLINFKGVRELTIDFNRTATNIYGRNGSGKTTVFDAFTWLLFGKDSSDRKAFDLKTLDADGNIIPQLPHEVSAVINVNGTDITLTRRFTEKWVKRAGKINKEFDGNKEERFFNDVPCSKAEYEAHIAEICSEDIFKFITSPTYFTSQKDTAQKAMLHQMAGNITDAEIAAGNPDFEALLDAITGKTLEEFKKEIGAKKARINEQLNDIPGRIDEKQRDIAEAEAEDWVALDAELQEKRKTRADIEKQLDSIQEAQRMADAKTANTYAEINELRQQQMKRRSEITEEVMRDYQEAYSRQAEAKMHVRNILTEITNYERDIEQCSLEVTRCTDNRTRLIDEWRRLDAKVKQIQAEQLHIDENAFICPTCKRPLDVVDIEEKEAQMLQNFEQERGKRLAVVAEAVQQNKLAGIANNERKQAYEARIAEAQKAIEERNTAKEAIKATEAFTAVLVKPDATDAINNDAQMKELQSRIDALTAEAQNVKVEDTSDLKDGRAALTEAIEELVAVLSKRGNIEADRKRVAELEAQMQKLNVQLADLERREFVIAEFSKARSAAIEARINGLFSLVRFRWTATQINGAEKETCEATINGVPYSSLNHAGQITAGLDIINAICKSQDICAPIFIDNAESINDIIPMQSQIINLIVSRDAQLRVDTSDNQ